MNSQPSGLVAGSKGALKGLGVVLAYFGIVAVLMYPAVQATLG